MTENIRNNQIILAILFFGVMMGALDIAIVGPALRPIQDAFQINTRDMTAIFTVYVLMNLVGTPILAKISDTIGRKVVYLTCISLFAAGSLLVAFAPSFMIVLVGRAVQGFGAGGIFPVASAVIGDLFPDEKRGRLLGLIGAVFGIAFILGPLIGGILLLFSWHLIFLVNIPIAIALLYFANRYLPKLEQLPSAQKKGAFDWMGTILLSLMLASFVYGISQIDTKNFLPSIVQVTVWCSLLTAFILLVAVVFVEKKVENPIIPPRLFSSKQLNMTHALAFGAGCLETSIVFIPALTRQTFEVTSSNSSFLVLPAVIAVAIGSPSFGRMLDKIGARSVLIISTTTLTIGLVMLILFMSHFALFIVATFMIGLGMSGLLGAPLRYILLGEVQNYDRSTAQGVMTLFMSAGQLISAAAMGAIIASFSGALAGYREAYTIIAILSVLLFAAAFQLKKREQSPRFSGQA